MLGLVPEVEGDDHGYAALTELEGECEIPLEISGVDDVHDHSAVFIEDLSCDVFCRAGGIQAVAARDVDDGDAPPGQLHEALKELHGGARVVGAHGTDAGKTREDHALSHVGVPNEEYSCGDHVVFCPCWSCAWVL